MTRRVLLTLALLFLPVLAQAATTKWLESGTDATQSTVFYSSTAGTVTSATDQQHTGPRSLKLDGTATPAGANATTTTGILADAGRRVQFWFRANAFETSTQPMWIIKDSGGNSVWNLTYVLPGGTLRNNPTGATSATGTAVPSTNTWTHLCISYFITNTTTYQFKVYVNGVLDSTTNAGTLTRTGTDRMTFGWTAGAQVGANTNWWFDDVVVDDGASSGSQPDCGDERVTAKRPFSNGTTNGFTGSGTPSSYGSGNARYVNQQPLDITALVSVVAAGVTTEEYNVEGITVGDVNLAGQILVDIGGWIYASALLSETASLVLVGGTSNAALTSTNTLFQAYAGSTTYPPGTGTDIGITTTALATTVSLYEAGILIAYTPVSCTGSPFTLHGVGGC